jgi:cell division protein FtsB
MKIGLFEINLRRLGVLITIGVVLALVMNFNTRLEELSRLQNEVATVRIQATSVFITQQALETQVALATSPAAAEEFARDQAHMAQPGDQVFVVIPAPGATAPAINTPAPVDNKLTKWDVWMELIFGN